MKKFIPLFFFFLPCFSFAQIYFGSPTAAAMGGAVTATVKDWEAIEINPANLGWNNNHTLSMSVADIGLNLEDNAMSVNELKRESYHDSLTPLQHQQIINALTAPGGLNLSATVTWAAISFSIPKIGGFAFNLTDELFVHAQLGQNAANAITDIWNNDTAAFLALARQDPDVFLNSPSNLLDGTNASGYHYRELNMDYGRKILTINIHGHGKGGASFENSEYLGTKSKTSDTISNPLVIYAGFGFKPIWGLGNYSGSVTGDQNNEEGSYVYGNPDYTNDMLGKIFSSNGRGYGIDLGLSASYKKWKLGMSAIDLGKITWQNNTFVPTTVLFPAVDTLVSIGKKTSKAFNYFTQRGNGANYTTQLPSKFRTGISYQVTKGILLSGDLVAPLNKVEENLEYPYVAVGAHINVFNLMNVSIGYAGEKEFPNVVPAGVFVSLMGGFEIFVATDDLLAYINQNSGRVVSAEAGIKLFGF